MTGPDPRMIDLRSAEPVDVADLRDHPLVERRHEFLRPVGVERESLGTHRVRQSAQTVERLAHAS